MASLLSLKLKNCEFLNCKANRGGAIYHYYKRSLIDSGDNNKFIDCQPDDISEVYKYD